MKNLTQITTALLFLLSVGATSAQQEKGIFGDDNWLYNWTEFKPSSEDYSEPTEILTGTITKDTKLSKRHIYLLLGNVFVTDSTTLTIEPGTVILGDYDTKASLTIAKGAKLIANGSETDPIIFTSNRSRKKEGDWGGIIILGDAPTNKFGNGSVATYYPRLDSGSYGATNYGGENTESNSGVLRYVRIEYAGKRIDRGQYFNGLLLAGVGSETILENIMVSYSAGNAFEVLGGNININKAVSYKTASVDFKFNFGAQATVTNSLVVRSPYASSISGSRCMELSSFEKRAEVDFNKPGTSVVAKNMTMINRTEDLAGSIEKGLVKEALFVGENTSLDMNKTVISGFNPAVIFASKVKVNQESLERIKFSEMYFNNCNGNIFVENYANNEDLENWYGNPSFFNVYSKGLDEETFIDVFNPKRPDFRLRINKIIATNDITD
ncbi:hypothetical protein [Winogradskyella sp. A3E31]|uniref:hypothetical protein n=1 Tax=Winogradskyella sp. A3E31 TaxID=3349637 RepID=UPI00398B90B0